MARKKKEPKLKPVKPEDIVNNDVVKKYEPMYSRAKMQMNQRTSNFDFYTKISHMQNLNDKDSTKVRMFSEGSTQAIKRKVRAQTIQRTPDGELVTTFDKNSIEETILDYLFKHKILEAGPTSNSMHKNLIKAFNASYDYGFACVRTGFANSSNGEPEVTFNLLKYGNVFPNPDCDVIEEADWYIIREWISRSELEALIDDKGHCKDSTFHEDTVRYILDTKQYDAVDMNSTPLADQKAGVGKLESIKVRTLYRRGDDKFITYVPKLNAILRETPNYDPEKDVPIHFLILEPDPEYPLGVSSIMHTLAQQQFADTFMTSAQNNLLLANNPPVMMFGCQTNQKIKMKPRSVWNLGTNPNARIEKFPVETSTLSQFGNILEQSANQMARNMNISDQTVASDAHNPYFGKTPQGVEAQAQDKTITINLFQKNVEAFFADWSNHALRCYLKSMGGKQEILVDEETRRKIMSIERSLADPENGIIPKTIIHNDKVEVDFEQLTPDCAHFIVRTGSLIQSRREEQQRKLQDLIVPISQMLGALPDQDKSVFTQTLMAMLKRLLEEADIDVSAEAGAQIDQRLMLDALRATMSQVKEQGVLQDQMAQTLMQMTGGSQPAPEGGQPPASLPQQQGQGMSNIQPEQPMPQPQGQPQ